MPLFEYVCAEGHREEYLEPYEFPNLRMCGECHGWLERVISAPSRAVIKNGCTGAQLH
jgi:predicted nucleic acid-binding Zn ribbon protein